MNTNSQTSSAVPAPHAGQQRVLQLPGRYRVAVCGRRFGKTTAAAIAAIRKCESAGRQRVWWISPVQEQSDRVEREIALWLAERMKKKGEAAGDQDAIRPKPEWEYRKSEHALIQIAQQSRIEFHSAASADHLRGAGLELLIVDEAADVSDDVWKLVLKPMLLEARGEAIILGTPRGTQHWLHRVYLLGQQPDQKGLYASIKLKTSDNPRIDAHELESYRQEMTEDEYKQEFDAEFIDGVNSLFANVGRAVEGEPLATGRRGETYVTGIDLGQKHDFTVLCSIACRGKRAEGLSRFNLFDWSDQLIRIEEHLKRFPGPCVVDTGGPGGPIYEAIRNFKGPDAHQFVFTAANKGQCVQYLSVALDRGELKLANLPLLIGELQAFRATRNEKNPNAPVRYGAPPGLHDDCVTALALAWWGLREGYAPSWKGNGLQNGFYA